MPQQDTIDHAVTSASSYRQRRDQGQLWTAPSGAVVRVRSLDIADHAVIDHFPDYLSQIMYRVIKSSSSLRPEQENDLADELFAGLNGKELLEREAEIGQVLCKLGWIEPQVVDEVTDPETQISIAELDAKDRRAYMGWVFGNAGQEAQALATFLEDREAVWELYQVCRAFRMMPSQRLGLETSGYSAATAYDFDRAVMVLGRTVEAKLAETDDVEVSAPRQPAKGHVWAQKPRYTLRQLLLDGETADGSDEADEETLPEFANLPTALL